MTMLLQKRSFGHMFAACGAQSRSRSEVKNLARPFSKKMSPFSKTMAFSKKIFSKIHFRKEVIPAWMTDLDLACTQLPRNCVHIIL
jgi:hypothetical protein